MEFEIKEIDASLATLGACDVAEPTNKREPSFYENQKGITISLVP